MLCLHVRGNYEYRWMNERLDAWRDQSGRMTWPDRQMLSLQSYPSSAYRGPCRAQWGGFSFHLVLHCPDLKYVNIKEKHKPKPQRVKHF